MPEQALAEEVEVERERFAVCKNPPSLPTPRASELRPENPAPVPLDLQPLIEAFIRYMETIGRAASTLGNHRINLKYWQTYLAEQGLSHLAEIAPRIVAGFQAWVYNRRTRYGRSFTIDSQIRILNSLQVFYQYLARTGRVLNNPADLLRLPRKPRRLPAVTLTPRELKRLLAQPDTSTVLGFRDRTLLEVLYSTGLRIGELVRLNVRDIDLTENLLAVRSGKGGKDRFVPLGATACRYLAEYVRRIRPLFRRASATDDLFFNVQGRRQQTYGVSVKLKLYAIRAGIEKRITVHTFRHTLATEMLKGGADLRQIQELLGHSRLRTTQLYTHVVKGELKRVQAECHPREQTELPDGFVDYRGRKYLTDEERKKDHRVRNRKSVDEP